MWTCRFEYKNFEQRQNKGILAGWHWTAFCSICSDWNYAVLVSASKDGRLAAFFLQKRQKKVIFKTKSFKQSFAELEKASREYLLAILVDGGKKSRYQCQRGVIFVSSQLQIPILPYGVWISHKIILKKSRDGQQIPLPFSKIIYCFGKPVWIPENLSKEQYLFYQRDLEHRIHELTTQCATF